VPSVFHSFLKKEKLPMLINRVRLIESIQASTSNDLFKDLVTVLKSHQLKDLLLTNVLLEAQTFKVLPLALRSISEENQLTQDNQTQAMLSWVIASQPKDENQLDDAFFHRISNGETCANCAADTVEKYFNQTCRTKAENVKVNCSDTDCKSVFYNYCKKLDNAISLTQAQENMAYN
jgi:hypothetical protein